MPGLYTVVSSKTNGMVVKSLVDGKSTFVSARLHGITPLDQISVYMQNDETTELWKVMNAIFESKTPAPAGNADNSALVAFFNEVLPGYDEQKVHSSAMKKMIKYCELLKQHNLLPVKEEATEEATES